MRLFITGGTGFVGRFVASEAIARGHQVRLLVRSMPKMEAVNTMLTHGAIDSFWGDLSNPNELVEPLANCDGVIHLAAQKDGDYFTQFRSTVIGTENLLAAMTQARVNCLIAVSTMSVYDYRRLAMNVRFDESAPLLAHGMSRDSYAETKLYQEELVQDFSQRRENRVVIIRPGMIVGPGKLWHPLLGSDLGPITLRVGGKSRPPITYVENTAEALVTAAELLSEPTGGDPDIHGEFINIIDDDLPTQDEYVEILRLRAANRAAVELPRNVKIAFRIMRIAALAVQQTNNRLFAGQVMLPGLTFPDQLDARFKPFRFVNDKAKRLLGWQPKYSVEQAIDRSLAQVEMMAKPLRPADQS